MATARHLEFVHDTTAYPVLNYICHRVGSKYQLYYIEERSGNCLTFHRKGESGPIIGTATYCEGELGSSNVKLVQSSATMTLEHVPRRLLFFSPKASFTFDGKKYSWKGLHNLFEEKTNRLVAQYQPTGSNNRLGQLSVSDGDQDFTDMVVVTAFVLQRSSDARKRAGSVA